MRLGDVELTRSSRPLGIPEAGIFLGDRGSARDQLERQVARPREDIAKHTLFMRLLAHEVRTPLAVIDGYSQLLGW